MIQEASRSHGLLESSGSDEGLKLIQEEDTQPYENTSEVHNEVAPIEVEPQNVKVSIRRSARIPQAPDRYDLKSNKWLEAMNTEMQSMKDNKVWVLVELPPNGRSVGSKWLFKKKTDMDSKVYTFKACLVAKGYTQTYGVDYGKTFSPVADIRAIRILLAIATFYDYEMDVKTTFLNDHLSEDVYMVQPEGFVDLKYPNKVCKVQRSIYGLKQTSRSWNKMFDVEIKKIGFTQNPDEPCVYLKASGSNVAFLILYVDDILIMGITLQCCKMLSLSFNLERQPNKETLHEKDSKSDLSVIKVQFDKFIHSEVLNPSNYNSYDRENRLKRLNERKFQIQKCKVQKVKATDASSGDTDNSGIVSDKGNDQSLENQSNTSRDESSGSRNECNEKSTSGDDTDIRPSYDTKTMAEVPYTAEYNVFAVETQHSDQPKNMNVTSLMEKVDSNTTPDSSDMCNNEFKDDQNADDHEHERVVLANLIENLKLDIDENKRFKTN
ncbi:retrotransposon protein, putative, ty1-copia subclass [Tanacetum coccineum]